MMIEVGKASVPVRPHSHSLLIALSVFLALGLIAMILIETFDLRQNNWTYVETKDAFTDVVSARAELDADNGFISMECETGKPIEAVVESQYTHDSDIFSLDKTNGIILMMRFDHTKPFSVASNTGSTSIRFNERFLQRLTHAQTFAAHFDEPNVTSEPLIFNHLGGTDGTIDRMKKACAPQK